MAGMEYAENTDSPSSVNQKLVLYSSDVVVTTLGWEYPKVCVNLQTDVRYNYSVWRLFLWQEKKTAHKKQQ